MNRLSHVVTISTIAVLSSILCTKEKKKVERGERKKRWPGEKKKKCFIFVKKGFLG
jgi:hypothetical protein